MSYFNDDKNETVRQTLERIMKEKGMWREPKVMHTEIGDFHYFDDDNTNTAGGTATGNAVENAAGATAVMPPSSSNIAQNTYTPSPTYGAFQANNYQIQSAPATSNSFGTQPTPSWAQNATHDYISAATDNRQPNQAPNNSAASLQAIPDAFGMPQSLTTEAIHHFAPNAFTQYFAPNFAEQTMNAQDMSSTTSLQNNRTTYNQFLQSDAFNKLRDFHLQKEGYNRTIDANGLVFPYPDINGDITGCIGHNMKNDFNTHPWVDTVSKKPMNSLQISDEKK